MDSAPLFPNYMQLRERSLIPPWFWNATRIASVIGVLFVVTVLFIAPSSGLKLFWGGIVPILPALFFIAPGIWRNICPLAAVNQTPRVFDFTRGLKLPDWTVEYGYVIGFGLFFVLASSRKWLFNGSGPATGVLILTLLGMAFIGGLVFRGKSGWCSSFCPLLPIQRIYNQTPFLTIPNSHCSPCVGCTKNCYDFNPAVANLADLYDDDQYYRNYRKFFVAAFPGFILAFFSIPGPPDISILAMYLNFALYIAASLATFTVLDSFVKVTTPKITTLFGAAALNLFYWYVTPAWLGTIFGLFGATAPVWLVWATRASIWVLTAIWIARSYAKEPKFVGQLVPTEDIRITRGAANALRQAVKRDQYEIIFMPEEKRVLAEPGRSLLEIAEKSGLPIEPGCRMGVCGADPVAILSGIETLSEVKDDERSTLDRLGLGAGARMACMARISGSVTMTMDLTQAKEAAADRVGDFSFDPDVRRVVIIGNGIAGVTAADYIRRYHPDCEIHLVGRESHHLYNRMAITRLIYGRSAMNGLYLQPDSWYEEKRITSWLNTRVDRIDPEANEVLLAVGEKLPYDRLVLATGSKSFVPPIKGYGLPGTYVLREAEDAMDIRSYVQEHRTRHAVVAGGGLLGLEAAYALHKLGLHVSVLERSEWLLRRQLDRRASQFLRRYLIGLGLEIVLEAEAGEVLGEGRIQELVLKDGRRIQADLLLVCVGIRSNLELAEDIGLSVNRGVLVDARMRTSDQRIFAAGDVCEYEGYVYGLWPMAVEQAKVAAVNVVGGDQTYTPGVPATMLKVVGVELTSIGQINAKTENEIEITLEEIEQNRYRKLVIADGKIIGTILLGYPLEAPAVTAAIKQGLDVTPHLDALREGRWEVLKDVV